MPMTADQNKVEPSPVLVSRDSITLREYVDLGQRSQLGAVAALEQRFLLLMDAHKSAHESERSATREAITKADTAMTIRLEQMNEFREQISKERNTYMTKGEFQRIEDSFARRFEELEKQAVVSQGLWANQNGKMASVGVLLGLLSLVAIFVGLLSQFG